MGVRNELLHVNGTIVYQDKYGKLCLYHEHNESVVMLARDNDSLILIRQYRTPVDSYVMQLPGGGVNAGEHLESAVRREFSEETGFECGAVQYLGKMLTSCWRSNEVTHVFYTDEIVNSKRQQLEQYETIAVVRISIEECVLQIQSSTINDPQLTYAVLQAMLKGLLQLHPIETGAAQ